MGPAPWFETPGAAPTGAPPCLPPGLPICSSFVALRLALDRDVGLGLHQALPFLDVFAHEGLWTMDHVRGALSSHSALILRSIASRRLPTCACVLKDGAGPMVRDARRCANWRTALPTPRSSNLLIIRRITARA